MQWNPDLYEQFRRHRERPAWDLIQQISAENPRLIYDLGCGTGRVTTWLAERYPNAQVVGVDISESMLAEARSKDQPSNLRFELADLTTWQPTEKPDVIFSNATLHWLEDHEHVLVRLVGYLRSGGQFLMQVPRNFAEPDHQVIKQVVHDGPWAASLIPLWRDTRVSDPATYVSMLTPHCARLEVWETTYWQVLRGLNPVARWIEGAALRPYLSVLGDDRAAFIGRIDQQIAAAYPHDDAGQTLYPFKRLFVVAKTPDETGILRT